MASLADAGLPEEVNAVWPHSSVHMTWEHFGRYPEPKCSEQFLEMMQNAFCWGSPELIAASVDFCKGHNVTTDLNPYEWVFEGEVFSGRPSATQAHRQRRAVIEACPEFEWDRGLLDQVFTGRITR